MGTNRLVVRHPKFDLTNIRHYWAADNVILTHFLNCVHIVIPAGERFFIKSVMEAADQIDDDAFAQEVRAFVGQEGWHSKIHTEFWEVLDAQGLPATRFSKFFDKVGVDWLQNRMGARLSVGMRLSITSALEHYTAILSEVFFDPRFPMEEFDGVMSDLHRWHAMEEFEHRAVAFDMLQIVDPRYRTRVIGFIAATMVGAFFALAGFFFFMFGDQELRRNKRGWRRIWRDLAIVRNPAIGRAARPSLHYLKRDFHPNHQTEPKLLPDFLAGFEQRYGAR